MMAQLLTLYETAAHAMSTPIPPDGPLTKSNVVAAFVESIHGLGSELNAWRVFGADVVAFLKERGINEEFGKWQEKRRAKAGRAKAKR